MHVESFAEASATCAALEALKPSGAEQPPSLLPRTVTKVTKGVRFSALCPKPSSQNPNFYDLYSLGF